MKVPVRPLTTRSGHKCVGHLYTPPRLRAVPMRSPLVFSVLFVTCCLIPTASADPFEGETEWVDCVLSGDCPPGPHSVPAGSILEDTWACLPKPGGEGVAIQGLFP